MSKKGLKIKISGLYAFFRIPYNSLLMDTYRFPPKTTIVGMIGAALGWNEKNFLENIRKFKYGVVIESPGELIKEVSSIFKSKNAPIYPIKKIMIYKPVYNVYLSSEDETIVEETYNALRDPKYVLTLGDSENIFYPKKKDFVELMEINETETKSIKCIIPTDLFRTYTEKFEKLEESIDILVPSSIKVPIDFIGKGKKRRFYGENVTYFSGIELHLKEILHQGIYDFNGDKIYLF